MKQPINREMLAARLRDAYVQGAVEPLRDGLEPSDAQEAYAIQSINTNFWLAEGRRLAGWKIGLTARSVQQQLGVDQPDYGALFSDMQLASGDELDASSLLQPKVEAEIAIVLGQDIDDPHVTPAELRRALAYVSPAIEIVDSRIADWRITFADTVADNGSSARFVLGEERRSAKDVDLYTCGMVLEVDGSVESLGVGAACLGHPLNAAVWLARTMIAQGQPLKAGQVVLTGALGPMIPLSHGRQFTAKIGGIGEVSFARMVGP